MTWELRLGSCLDPTTGLSSLADQSVAHVIADPPYDEYTHKNGRRGHKGREISKARDLGFAALTVEQMQALAVEFQRITRRWVLIFCRIEMLADWREALEDAGLEYIRCGIWRKLGSTPQFTGDRPGSGAEAIVIAHRPGRKRWNGGGRVGVWEAPIVANGRLHTTQKPLSLMSALVADFTDRGDLICDCFAGSATTGVAAIQAGRSFVGWELDPTYHAASLVRLGDAREQLTLLRDAGPRARQLSLGDIE